MPTPLDHLAQTLAAHDADQPQREALMDLAVWAIYADGRIQHEENEQLDAVVEQLSVGTLMPLRSYLNQAIAKVRDAWNDAERAETLLDDIYRRLGSQPLRQTAYDLCESLSHADSDLADTEQVFLQRIHDRFGLDA